MPLHRAIPVPGPIGDANRQITFEAALEMESARRLGEVHEDIVQHVLDAAAVIEQGGGHPEQTVPVLLIDPAQRRRVPAIEPPDKYSYPRSSQNSPNSNNRLSHVETTWSVSLVYRPSIYHRSRGYRFAGSA